MATLITFCPVNQKPAIVVAADGVHRPRFWSKAVAFENIPAKLVALATVQVPIGWLNGVCANMEAKDRTPPVDQYLIRSLPPLLKAVAPANMLSILVTWRVCHTPTFWLNEVAPAKVPDRSVTLLSLKLLISQLVTSGSLKEVAFSNA
ncbi:unannotated protein [freshwater metagenome]|uniref:Unannotated protein n=1 Tax=freshwater metagenome TaxID=449393 RepID=A0A6J7JXY2_9ZZZZ